jgi:hypothetical protein
MENEQFTKLMGKLEEIRCGIIDVETNTIIDNEYTDDYVLQIRKAFFYQLNVKTDWRRNEIKTLFESAIKSII